MIWYIEEREKKNMSWVATTAPARKKIQPNYLHIMYDPIDV